MNIKIVDKLGFKRADCQFNGIRKRWTIPAKVYQHLQEADRESVCKKWAGKKVLQFIAQQNSSENEIEEKIPESTPAPTAIQIPTVKEKFPLFLSMVSEQGTRDRYETDWTCYLSPHIGDLTVLEAATEANIDQLKASLVKQPHTRSKTPKFLNTSTVNGALNTLRAFFHWAKRQRLIDAKPEIERLKQFKPTRLPKEKRYTETQQDLILSLAYEKSPMFYAAFLAGLDLGLRIGETVGLKWSDIDWERSEVSISRTIKVTKQEKITIEVLPKNKTPDVVALSSRLADALKAIQPKGATGRIFQKVKTKGAAYIPGPITVNILGYWVETILTKAQKIDPEIIICRNFHKFRHSFATNLADRKGYITTIQEMLRHKAISSTMHYLHSENKQEIKDLLESIGKGKQKNNSKLRVVK